VCKAIALRLVIGVVVVILFAELFTNKGVGVLDEAGSADRVGVTRIEIEAQGFTGAEAKAGLWGQAGTPGADDVSLDGGNEVGVYQGVSNIGLTEAGLHVLRQFDSDADDRIGHMVTRYGVEDSPGGVFIAGGYFDIDGHEGSSVDGVEVEVDES